MSVVRCRLAVAAVLLLTTASLHAQVRTGPLADRINRIEKAISSEMSRQNIPGMSMAIATDGALRWSNGYGLADLENFVPAKPSTVYRLGSISKPITAVAVMQLAERGKLDLDAPVQKYCPAFPQKQWPVTSRQLLGHLAGVRHYNSDAEFGSTRHYESLVEGLSMFKDDPLLHQPGTKYSYTTHGYAVLGCVVEGASGMTFKDYVSENIFKPAGMDRIRVDDVFEIIPNRAQGYARKPSGELRNSALADTSYKIPGGGFCSTVEDLVKFAIAVQSGKLVQSRTLEQIWTKQKTSDGTETAYGLGFGIATRNGLRIVSHGGGQQRVSTVLYMVPEKNIVIAIMLNLEGAGSSLGRLTEQITDILLDARPSEN